MAQQRMGDVLRTRREELGYSLDSAARATNIRTRVLDAFESSDYGSLPPIGYAQGMLSSYARFLEMDPRYVLSMFETELALYDGSAEAEEPRRSRTGTSRSRERRATGTHSSLRSAATSATGQFSAAIDHEQAARNDDRYKSGTVRVVSRRPGASGTVGVARRRAANVSDPFAPGASSRQQTGQRDRSYGVPTISSPRTPAGETAQRAGEGRASNRSGRRSASRASSSRSHDTLAGTRSAPVAEQERGGGRDEAPARGQKRSSSRRRRGSQPQARTEGSAQDQGNVFKRVLGAVASIFRDTRTRLIAIAVILLVLAVGVAASFLISTAGNSDTGVIAVEGGVDDPTKTDTDAKGATATITTTNGNPVTIEMSVAEGQTCLINVTFDDDNAYNGTAVGPWSRKFVVSESLNATFGSPDAVTVTENGTQIPVEKEDDGTGKLVLQIESKSTTGKE